MDRTQLAAGHTPLTHRLEMLMCQRPKCDSRAARVMSDCRVYSGRSAGGHVPAIYYYNTHTHTH